MKLGSLNSAASPTQTCRSDPHLFSNSPSVSSTEGRLPLSRDGQLPPFSAETSRRVPDLPSRLMIQPALSTVSTSHNSGEEPRSRLISFAGIVRQALQQTKSSSAAACFLASSSSQRGRGRHQHPLQHPSSQLGTVQEVGHPDWFFSFN